VEFLPDWYPKVRQRKRLVAMQAWASMALICVLGLWMLLAQRNVRAKEVELSSLRKDLNQSEEQLQQLEDLLQLQQQLGRQDQIFVKIGRPVEATKLVTTLEQLMPRDMALMGLTLETEDPAAQGTSRSGGGIASRSQRDAKHALAAAETKLRLRLHGVAPTDVDLGEFLAKLQSKPFFKQIELIYSHERQDSGHVMREFEVCFVMELGGIGTR
jgi:hypothetical protein